MYPSTDLDHLRMRLRQTLERISPEFRTSNQVLGTKRTIGCVALEVTQRCNLDCSICYLSENSESTPDLPLDTLLRRIDKIREQYGVGTNVQITGGDPTLRNHDELERIVRHCRENYLFPALFTNGINASRELLQRLCEAGLMDVAFHVDLTEKRKGYRTEEQLNEVRHEYIERARGLKLEVIFNQTVFRKNYDEVPKLVRFYRQHADVVGMASFQLQADTGRGANRHRADAISIGTVSKQIEEGLGTTLSWDNVLFGHPKCHKIGYSLVLGPGGERVIDLWNDKDKLAEIIAVFDDVYLDRSQPGRAVLQGVEAAIERRWLRKGLRYFGGRAIEHWRDLLASRGHIYKLSFFMQNFQDAHELDHERIDNCSFHCMTDEGGVSMCVHNAHRDHYLQRGTGYPEAYQNKRREDGFDPILPGRVVPAAAK
jgi:7,8-dihydro-6-hydroxymethylpterin dimethyltransferase